MMRFFMAMVLLSSLVASCNKERFKKFQEAENHCFGGHNQLYGPEYFDPVMGNKMVNNHIVEITNQAILDSIISTQSRLKRISGEGERAADFYNGFDFNSKALFAVYLVVRSNNGIKFNYNRIKISEPKQEIKFDFELTRYVGGSGMTDLPLIWFIEIPKDQANYSVFGEIGVGTSAGINALMTPHYHEEFEQ